MTEEMHLEVNYKELIDLGLNEKAENMHAQLDRLLKEVVNNRVKAKYPGVKNQPWHFVAIVYSSISDKYRIKIAPGHPVQKG